MRHLYGASTADFAAQSKSITTTTDGIVNGLIQLVPGTSYNIFDAPAGSQITDLLGVASPNLTEGSAVIQVTALANGTIPFFAPDDEAGTVYVAVDDGAGGFIYYPINPSKIGDIVADLQTQVDGLGVGGSGFSGDYADLTNVPGSFNPILHNHNATDVVDSTAVGRTVLKAVDAQAARAAIGAGTGNGTSNLVLGTGAANASPGNHSHPASNVSATPFTGITGTDVQTQLQQVAASAGGVVTGSSAILLWQYASGAWPALPATKPAGVLTVWGQGPVQPTTYPAWVGVGGAGAGQATLLVDIVPLT